MIPSFRRFGFMTKYFHGLLTNTMHDFVVSLFWHFRLGIYLVLQTIIKFIHIIFFILSFIMFVSCFCRNEMSIVIRPLTRMHFNAQCLFLRTITTVEINAFLKLCFLCSKPICLFHLFIYLWREIIEKDLLLRQLTAIIWCTYWHFSYRFSPDILKNHLPQFVMFKKPRR